MSDTLKGYNTMAGLIERAQEDKRLAETQRNNALAEASAIRAEVERLRVERKMVVDALNDAASEGHFDGYDEDTELLRSLTSHWNRMRDVYNKEYDRAESAEAKLAELNALRSAEVDALTRMRTEMERQASLKNQAERERDVAIKEAQLLEAKVITCGVAADTPDPNLSRKGAYGEKWDSPQAERVRRLREDRDNWRAMARKMGGLMASHCRRDCDDLVMQQLAEMERSAGK